MKTHGTIIYSDLLNLPGKTGRQYKNTTEEMRLFKNYITYV